MTNVTPFPMAPPATGPDGRELTPYERALIDIQQETERAVARLRVLNGGQDPAVPMTDADAKPQHPWTPEMVAELTRPVRIEISFDDPVKTRQQLEALMAAFVEAQVLSQAHALGQVRQRMQMRNTVKLAADVVTSLNGKRPRSHRS